MFLQEQLNQLATCIFDFDDLRTYPGFTDMYHFDHAFEYLVRKKLTPELQRLPDDQRSGAH